MLEAHCHAGPQGCVASLSIARQCASHLRCAPHTRPWPSYLVVAPEALTPRTQPRHDHLLQRCQRVQSQSGLADLAEQSSTPRPKTSKAAAVELCLWPCQSVAVFCNVRFDSVSRHRHDFDFFRQSLNAHKLGRTVGFTTQSLYQGRCKFNGQCCL